MIDVSSLLGPFLGWAAVAVVFVLILIILGLVAMRRFQHGRSLKKGHDLVVLLLRIPKESLAASTGEKPVVEQIAVSETFFSVIGGMRAQRGVRASVLGRDDHFAFEIVAHGGLISFYMAVPREFQQFFEEQLHAQYPTAQIEEVEDYNAFTPTGLAVGTELSFVRPSAFPIRTYKQTEVDPLAALTNALSRLGEHESGVIQYVVRSAHPRWHRSGVVIAEKLRSGKTLDQALGKAGGTAQVADVLSASFKKPSAELQPERLPSSRDQQLIQFLEEKTAKAGLEVTIRLVVSAPGAVHAKQRLQGLVDAFTQYRNYEYGNGFHATGIRKDTRFMLGFIYRTFHESRSVVLNTEEMASLFHPPLPGSETPNINWLTARTLPAPTDVPASGILLGENVYRSAHTKIFLETDDRRRHTYVIGTTGTGKSVLLANMAIQDIHNGQGVGVIDPHGSTVETILDNIPQNRMDDVILFDPSDVERPIGLNMLEAATPHEADFAVQEMIAIFYKLVTDPSMIGPMFEHNMRNAMLTLMANKDYPGTIADIPRIFTDTAFQRYAVSKVTDPVVRAFWEKEMAKTTDYHKSEMLGYLISKVGRFVENAMMRNIIGQAGSGFNFRQIMDGRKIFLVNLSKGKIGEVNSNLLGLILVAKLQMAALARADMPEHDRTDFYLYIDEFQNFITDSIAIILSEARKYRLNLILAHQYIGQLVVNNDTRVRDAVFGNVGTIVSFRVGVDDAETLAQQLAPYVTEFDVVNIERFHAYCRLLVRNTASRAFTLKTLPPPAGDAAVAQQLRVSNRLCYGRPRAEVEREILERTKLGQIPAPAPVADPAATRT
ncbi:MAG: type IV secretion system DNA-binding domain-containing protein [Candidatus Kerfeldbacteria bacterium]|nr:type IV secretion system DNA-binding domain-containing protein [Candidatus Kerfeldbacteria bacterium]